MIRPPRPRIGETARTERPSVPFSIAVNVRPRCASRMRPMYGLPISVGCGCEYRMPAAT